MPLSKSKWEISEHTEGKHQILKHYLGGWLPILGSNFRRLVYIDGFAGPGQYLGGESGSPLIALDRIEQYLGSAHSGNVEEVVCLFVEADKERSDHLRSKLSGRKLDRIKIHVENDTFEKGVTEVLDGLEENSSNLAPSFTMIDPFGVKGVRMETIGRILKHPRSECMITFMDESINRFKGTSAFHRHLVELFGTADWGGSDADLDILNPSQTLRDRFVSRLKEEGAEYVLPFKIWRKNRHIYTIFFVTKSLKGCDLMKKCMWKVDSSGGYSFRDVYSNSQDLFQRSGVNLVMEPFLKDLTKRFGSDCWVQVEDIDEFAKGDETIFHLGQLRRATLGPAEKAGRIQVKRPGGVKGFSAGEGVRVKFRGYRAPLF